MSTSELIPSILRDHRVTLKSQGGILFGLRPDSQRYFDYHHTADDRIEMVNERELKMGAAAMTSLVYMLDKFIERVN